MLSNLPINQRLFALLILALLSSGGVFVHGFDMAVGALGTASIHVIGQIIGFSVEGDLSNDRAPAADFLFGELHAVIVLLCGYLLAKYLGGMLCPADSKSKGQANLGLLALGVLLLLLHILVGTLGMEKGTSIFTDKLLQYGSEQNFAIRLLWLPAIGLIVALILRKRWPLQAATVFTACWATGVYSQSFSYFSIFAIMCTLLPNWLGTQSLISSHRRIGGLMWFLLGALWILVIGHSMLQLVG